MTPSRTRTNGRGLTVNRHVTGTGNAAVPPITWVNRSGMVHAVDGKTIGRSMCEAPADWSQLAVDTAVTRYFTRSLDTVQPKTSIRALVERVTHAIAASGRENGIFRATCDADNYQAELACACLLRYGWFTESVWRDTGMSRLRAAKHAHRCIKAATRPEFKSQKPSYLPVHASDDLVRDRKRLQIIARSVHGSGAATIHFDDTIAAWHTCPASGPVVGATPSTGYLFLDKSTCKAATINVNRFLDNEGRLDIDALRHVVTLFAVALDILVDGVDSPDRDTARNNRSHRPIGLSYAGLAPLLMRLGVSYDSESARDYAAALTSFITATACATSQRLAVATQPFSQYKANRESMIAVIRRHAAAAAAIGASGPAGVLQAAALKAWEHIVATASTTGFRNAHLTTLSAAGLAGLILDCDASDLGPMISLVKYIRTTAEKIDRQVHPCIGQSLAALGYSATARSAILAHILDKETIKGAPGLKQTHLPVFDCQFPSRRGGSRALSVESQMKMIASVQPSLSGCTQRSLALPPTVGPAQLAALIQHAWTLRMRTLDLYRSDAGR